MSICATIIVKDEAQCIERCLDSIPFVDALIVSDTGSKDGTQEILRKRGVTVREDPWRSFSYNRNVALDAARRAGHDFALIIDADDTLQCVDGFTLPTEHDLYDFETRNRALVYPQAHLIRLSKPFHYRGVTHEFLDCAEPFTRATAQGVVYQIGHDGSRRASGKKASEDVYLLRQALMGNDEPDLAPRYTFYLAQSLRECGDKEGAFKAYTKRIQMGGWHEEVFMSYYQAALLTSNRQSVLMCMDAMQICPDRVEPYWLATRTLNRAGIYQAAWTFAQQGATLVMPKSGLFVESWIYQYGMLDELSIAACYVGEKGVGKRACEYLLGLDLPENYKERIQRNLSFCL